LSAARDVAAKAKRNERYLRVKSNDRVLTNGSLRESRGVVEKHGDTDIVDMLTLIITEFEKTRHFSARRSEA
jgi:hypothetical protein